MGMGTSIKFEAEIFKPGGAKPMSPKKAAPPNSAGVTSQRVASYLDKHHLEARLSDAMQAVLREQPDDPAAFLAEQLASNGGIVAKLPKPPKTPKSPAAPILPPAEDEPKQAKVAADPKVPPTPMSPLAATKPKEEAEAAEEAPKSAPPPPPEETIAAAAEQPPAPQMLPFGQYYAANFKGRISPRTFAELYSQFPEAAVPPPLVDAR